MEMLLNSSSKYTHRTTEGENPLWFKRLRRVSSLDQLCFHSRSFLNYPFKIDQGLLKKVVSDFSNELKNKEWFLENVSSEFLNNIFIYSISNLIKLNPSFLGVELTVSNSLFIFSKIAGFNTHLEIFFDEDVDSEKYDVVINVYNEGAHILSQMGNIDESIGHLESVLPKETRTLLNLIEYNDYSVSRNSLTETTV